MITGDHMKILTTWRQNARFFAMFGNKTLYVGVIKTHFSGFVS